jgi:hypothetical protein
MAAAIPLGGRGHAHPRFEIAIIRCQACSSMKVAVAYEAYKPLAARGLAYVQNHPIAHAGIAPAYDAINEVCFDDLETMRSRIDVFRHNDVKQSNADLVREAHFLILRECVIYPRSK